MSKKQKNLSQKILNIDIHNKRVGMTKLAIDNMIADVREKINLEEENIANVILRKGALQLEDGTMIAYSDILKNGNIEGASLSIYIKERKSRWEINGSRSRAISNF